MLCEAVELQETMHGSYVMQEHLILAPLRLHLFSKESGLTEATIKLLYNRFVVTGVLMVEMVKQVLRLCKNMQLT